MPEPKRIYTAFRCPEDLLELAKTKARKQRRSLSNYLIVFLERAVTEPAPPADDPQ